MTKKPSEIRGLLVPENKTFYYLEANGITVANSLDRISKILLSRDLIRETGEMPDLTATKPVVMTLLEATEKGYHVQALYITQHIKKVTKDNTIPVARKIGWK